MLSLILIFTNTQAKGFEGKIDNRVVVINLQAAAGDSYVKASPEKQKAMGMEYMTKSTDELKKMFNLSQSSGLEESGPFMEIATEIFIKNKKMRMDMGEGEQKASYIIDLNERLISIIQMKQKMVIKMDMDKMKNQMQGIMQMAQGSDDTAQESKDLFSLKSTGNKEKVHGYNCEIYQGTGTEGQPIMVWLSKKLEASLKSAMMEMAEAMGKINPEAAESEELNFYKKEKGVAVVKKSLQNDKITIVEVLKVKSTSVADEKFLAPAGFKEMDMMKMMQGMGF